MSDQQQPSPFENSDPFDWKAEIASRKSQPSPAVPPVGEATAEGDEIVANVVVRDGQVRMESPAAVPPGGEDDPWKDNPGVNPWPNVDSAIGAWVGTDAAFRAIQGALTKALKAERAQTRLQHAEQIAEKDKEIAILKLAVPLEEELSAKIDEMHKYLSMGQGFTLNGIGQLLDRCQRRMAADWVEIGSERRQRQQAESSLVQARQEIVNTKAENAALREENAALKQKQG